MLKRIFFLALLALGGTVQAGVAIEHWQSPVGTRVYFVHSPALPILDVQLDFAAGSMFDPPGKEGLAGLTHGLLDLGAGELDETDISNRMADVGASLGGSLDKDRASLSLRTLSRPDRREAALAVLEQVLRQPRFEAAILAREQGRSIAALKDALTRPDTQASRAFWAALYPAHPYGRLSTPESLAAVRQPDLREFWRKHYNAANATLTLVGDISRAEAEALAQRLSAALPSGEPVALPAPPVAANGQRLELAYPASQAHILVGMPSVVRGDPDFFPLLVGNYTLGGGGFVSRLMQEVREKRGFAYSVYSYFAPMRQAGPFQIGLQTKKEQAEEALTVVRQVLTGFLAEGPTPAELEAAKANLIGSFPLRLDSNRKILDHVAMIGFYGLPLDYLDTYQARVRAVSAADIRRAFARHVQPEQLVTVTVAAG
ncbi:MAG: pitrilysin family protein [Azovibrio sp.]|uniref:M16 family metallopeptidase n=1 Tax=Azovibrio sp. TaxID=1872673 RepID=UPI003C71A77F